MKTSSQQFFIFSKVGIISGLMDVSLLLALVQLGVRAYFAITVAFFFGLGINLWLHANLTFQTRLSIQHIGRFLLVVCMNYGFTLGVVLIFEHLGLSYVLGKIISLPVVAIHGFLWSRLWVFKL
jgi:putative flippase GtrA